MPPNIFDKRGQIVLTHIGYLRNKDKRDLLMYAFKKLHINLFSTLIQFEFDLDRKDFKGKLSIDFAAKKFKSFQTKNEEKEAYEKAIGDLLFAGSPFPNSIYYQHYKDLIRTKEYLKLSENLRYYVLNDKINLVAETIEKYPKLRFFYDTSNQSLMCFLIKRKSDHVNGLYDTFDLGIGDHEELELLKKSIVQKLESKNIIFFMLLKKFRYMNGTKLDEKHQSFVKEALEELFQNDISSVYIHLCAANKKSVIFMDFENEYYEDSKVPGKTSGVTNAHGLTYIAAKNFLDTNKKSQTIATMAHEFCHQSMHYTYMNSFNPYPLNESSEKLNFEKIFNDIKFNTIGNDELVSNVFYYDEAEQHSELIVTPAQMALQYPEIAYEIEVFYQDLYQFTREQIFEDIKLTIPVLIRLQQGEDVKFKFLTVPMQIYIENCNIYYDDDQTQPISIEDRRKIRFENLPPKLIRSVLLESAPFWITRKKKCEIQKNNK